MSIFNYTLPSGASFTLTAPSGTTQIEADKIFYSQVAAGTFVGYQPGDTLTHPAEALTNFGLSRLQRGTAGVDDKTLLAVISGLPIVAPLPTLTNVPVSNAINQANYIQVNSDPIQGVYSLGPSPIGTGPNSKGTSPVTSGNSNNTGNNSGAVNPTGAGQLSAQQMQSVMAQIASIVNQDASVLTQKNGVGKYGFNIQQLEQAGYIKPGFSQMYSVLNPSTQANIDAFTCILTSPAPWTGLNGVYSVNDILKNPSLQNKIQEKLMNQSYNSLVSTGVIVPPPASSSKPSITTGKIYTSSGTLSDVSALTLLNSSANINKITNDSLTTPVGITPTAISNLGIDATATYNAGLSSLSTGAVGFTTNNNNGSVLQQLGLASGLSSGPTAGVTASVTSSLNGDIGALVANSSKYGVSLTLAWAQSSSLLSTVTNNNLINSIGGGALNNINNLNSGGFNTGLNLGGLPGAGIQTFRTASVLSALAGPALAQLNSLAKSVQFGVNFSDFILSGLVSGVRPSPGFNNTVNRSTLDASVNRVIGSNLISPPVFELPSVRGLGISADIGKAQNILLQGVASVTAKIKF
jgi:hypothetical protein